MNSTIKHSAVECEPVEYPVCMNGYPPLKIPDESGCCYKYQCQCICSGFGDPHYITFDGTYYPFQGNCSYVLVKEIDLKYNFSVIIDNVFCDSEDGLSCPKSLTIYYKSFEMFMAQENSAGVVTNLIYVNQKKVSMPFQSEEFRVTENGIESLVVIPEISAQIYFTGMMFSIHLPLRDFYGNTEGHCGTCDNNQSDDCRLPNGTIASSCQDMASHWHVKNSNSVCPPPKPEPTPIPCPPPAICKIIESELFEKCRMLVPHEPYVKACNLDVCHMSETIGCSSLQAYADECAMAGICVDWRSATDGACDLKCKEPQVYKACGPQVEPTCDERFNLKYIHQNDAFRALESMIWEGCHCPNGTTLLSPNSNICVPTCVCDVSLCPSKIFTCPVGFSVEITMGVCCPIYHCLPKTVCVFNHTEYKGFEYQLVSGQCCGQCVQTSCVTVYAGNITQIIEPGKVWSPPGDKCVKFDCVKIETQFITMEAKTVCPYFNPDECVPGTEFIAPDGCCRSCVTVQKHCNVSKMSTYLESNGCKTTMPVEMGTCDGSCNTYSMYSMKDKAVQHSCSCCREMATSEKKADLVCPDGSTITQTYISIEKCGCVETECAVQQKSIIKQRRKR
ncbi:intestinal mucin-like protein [Paramisgurnus dabryanus]|uniref:intestinal mucin-like protein n=1 Tax=Paramisgurnus dabryanus TaxID=90735 RepID=UPI003CCF6117